MTQFPLPLDDLAEQLTASTFHDLMQALPAAQRPPPSDPRWTHWIARLLQRCRGALPVHVMDWAEQQSPGAFLNTRGHHESDGEERAWSLFRAQGLDPEQQGCLSWLVRQGFLKDQVRPGYALEEVLTKQWWPVAEALVARAPTGSLAAVLGNAGARRALLQTREGWEWLLRQNIDLQSLVPLHGVVDAPAVATGGRDDPKAQTPQVPLWLKLAVHGLEPAAEWGLQQDPGRRAEFMAWRCAVAWGYVTSQAKPSMIADLLRRHPDGIGGRRPGTGVPEAWIAITVRPELLDVLTDAEVVAIPPTPSGQSVWFALTHRDEMGLTSARTRRLKSLVPLTVDARGRGLITGGPLRPPAVWPAPVRNLFHKHPELAWGTSEEESLDWMAAHAASSWCHLRHKQEDPVWDAACTHPHPESMSALWRGIWTVAALRTSLDDQGKDEVVHSVQRWLAAGIEWPDDRWPPPPCEEDGNAPPTIAAEMRAHPCWPLVRAHLQAQALQRSLGFSEEPGTQPPRRPRI